MTQTKQNPYSRLTMKLTQLRLRAYHFVRNISYLFQTEDPWKKAVRTGDYKGTWEKAKLWEAMQILRQVFRSSDYRVRHINYKELGELKDIFGVNRDKEYEEFLSSNVFNPYTRKVKPLSEVNPEELKLKEF